MPSARSSASARASEPRRQPRQPRQPRKSSRPSQTRAPARPRAVTLRAPALRIRWERVGRYGLLFVLLIVVGLYVEHTLSYFSTRSQADQQQALVNQLQSQNAELSEQARSLSDPTTIVRDARKLGMVRPGERSYAITGKPQR